ncbi:hypothetical protein ABPG72_022850 [Tetrahymena utriculariae]
MSVASSHILTPVKGIYNAILFLYSEDFEDFEYQLSICLRYLGFQLQNKVMKSDEDLKSLFLYYLQILDQQNAQPFVLEVDEWIEFFAGIDRFLKNCAFVSTKTITQSRVVGSLFLTQYALMINQELIRQKLYKSKSTKPKEDSPDDEDFVSVSSSEQDEERNEENANLPPIILDNHIQEEKQITQLQEIEKCDTNENQQFQLQQSIEEKVVQNQDLANCHNLLERRKLINYLTAQFVIIIKLNQSMTTETNQEQVVNNDRIMTPDLIINEMSSLQENNNQLTDQLTYQFTYLNQIKIEEENDQLLKNDPQQSSDFLDPGDIKEEMSPFSSELSNSESEPTKRQLQRPEELDKQYKQPRIHPYRFRDKRRDIISKDINLSGTQLLYQEIFGSKRKQQDTKRKEKLIKRIDYLFQLQEKSSHIPYNIKLNRIENVIEGTISILESVQSIPKQPDKLTSTQRKFYVMEDFTCNLTLKKNIQRVIPLFLKQYERFTQRTEMVVLSFLDRLTTKRFLPLNLKITSDTVQKCKNQFLIPTPEVKQEFWTIKIYNKLGFGYYIFNQMQLREVSCQLIKEKPDFIELMNLHDDDPRKFRSTKNLSATRKEEAILSMLPSDISWIFQYEDIRVKQFMELTHFMITDQEKQTIIQYFETFYYPIIILSQIPMFKLGNLYAINGSTIRINMKKLLRESQLETNQELFSYFEECIIINAPKQQLEGIINTEQKIMIDFSQKKFMITGNQLPKLINNLIKIKQINIIM